MRIAITRAPSQLGRGWIEQPVTRRVTLPRGVAHLNDVFETAQFGANDDAGALSATWVAVTSAHVFDVLDSAGITIPEHLPLACVGAATARRAGSRPAYVAPPPATADTLATGLLALPERPERVIFPCSQLASHVLEERLAGQIEVERIEVYTTQAEPANVEDLAGRNPDVVVVTASSAARALIDNWPGKLPALVAIGEPTAASLRAAGHPPAAVARTPDRAGLEEAIATLRATTEPQFSTERTEE